MIGPSPLVVALVAAALSPEARALELEAGPYVQNVGRGSAWVLWQGPEGLELAWGADESLGERAAPRVNAAGVSQVRLAGLEPGTTYHYALEGEGEAGTIHSFRTAPADPLAGTRILAISDSQMNYGEPGIFADLIGNVHERLLADAPGPLAEYVDLVLLPGDLVDDGRQVSEWTDDFLRPAQPLFASVPLYAALGNHEEDSTHYFDYLQLPSASPGAEHGERWYGFGRGNLRFVVLDGNEPYADQVQLDWLEQQLDRACLDPAADFVIAAYHFPPYCEVWPDGQSDFSQQAVEVLDAFATSCGKPVLSVFGHAHGYARGESRDARHLLLDAASIAGSIHEWGQMENLDHPEIALSLPEYGYVMIEAEAGDDPVLRFERFLLHSAEPELDHSARDRVELRRFAEVPPAPRATLPLEAEVAPACVQLAASPWDGLDGAVHGAHWQVSEGCDDFDRPSWESWQQDINLYQGVDRQAGRRLESIVIPSLEAQHGHCWRVRYRSEDLVWSEWSEPAAFETAGDPLPENLLFNPGAEEGASGWEVLEGPLEVIERGECDAIDAVDGSSSLALCGACDEGWFAGRIAQTVSLEPFAGEIDQGDAVLRWGGWARSSSGRDYVSFVVQVLDSAGNPLGDEQRWTFRSLDWSRSLQHTALPEGARGVRFEVRTSNVRPEHDCATFLDALELRVDTAGQLDACLTPPPYPDPLPEDTGRVDSDPPQDTAVPGDTAPPAQSASPRDPRSPELPLQQQPSSCGLPPSSHRSALLSVVALLMGWLLVRVRRREDTAR